MVDFQDVLLIVLGGVLAVVVLVFVVASICVCFHPFNRHAVARACLLLVALYHAWALAAKSAPIASLFPAVLVCPLSVSFLVSDLFFPLYTVFQLKTQTETLSAVLKSKDARRYSRTSRKGTCLAPVLAWLPLAALLYCGETFLPSLLDAPTVTEPNSCQRNFVYNFVSAVILVCSAIAVMVFSARLRKLVLNITLSDRLGRFGVSFFLLSLVNAAALMGAFFLPSGGLLVAHYVFSASSALLAVVFLCSGPVFKMASVSRKPPVIPLISHPQTDGPPEDRL